MLATVEGSNASASISYIHTDHLTGSALITNNTGSQLQLLDYHPWGTIRLNNQSSTFNEKRKFIGREYDQETGLSYLNARYYDPGRGQFISQDPVHLVIGSPEVERLTNRKWQELLGNPQVLNSYSYAGNNPIVNKDPEGRYLETVFDLAMFSWSLHDFKEQPGFWNGVLVGVDGLSLAVPIPAMVGALRHGVGVYQGFRVAKDIAKSAHWGNPASLVDHTVRHAEDFGLQPNDYAGYARAARDFLTEAADSVRRGDKNVDSFTGTGRNAGKKYYFDSRSSTYGVTNADGATATVYKPKGGDPQKASKYWSQKKKSGG